MVRSWHWATVCENSLSLSGGFTPCRHLRPSSGQEHRQLYNTFSPVMMSSYRCMKLGGNLPPRHDALFFSISGTGSFLCPDAQTRLDILRPLFTQSHRHGWTYQGLWLPSHRHGWTYQDLWLPSHRHGWTYQDLWLPSHTDTAGHTKTFDYPVTQTRLDIPRPLFTQSHRHGWTY